MGDEINSQHFTEQDVVDYQRHLIDETRLLSDWFENNTLSSSGNMSGFELEVWIVDRNYKPIPINEAYLKKLNSDWVSPELSLFNIELNGEPEVLAGKALSRLHNSLEQSWLHCCEVAQEFDASLVMIGILPSVREDQLTLENMSRLKRYHALNDQVFSQRKGKPLNLDIHGHEHLKTTHYDVMLESAATSFQLHWQVPLCESVRTYNASVIAAAATLAVSTNSPFLFGKDLWDETRIPLFEQAVQVGGIDGAAFGPIKRVSFGSAYVQQSVFELFHENKEHFPVLLPVDFNSDAREMNYLRLHNGTIWRWNRPLIGFDQTGEPHLRIEHRVISAGPTVIDSIANAAFYYGLTRYLSQLPKAPEAVLAFPSARDNFYNSAKFGLNAQVTWLQGEKIQMKTLLRQQLIDAAEQGLQSLKLDNQDIQLYIGIIRERIKNEQHGSNWQRQYMKKYSCDMQTLTAAYAERQQTGEPVHTWSLVSI